MSSINKSKKSRTAEPINKSTSELSPNKVLARDTNTNDEYNTTRDHERLDSILKNLNISFKNCIFTYKPAHLLPPQKEKDCNGGSSANKTDSPLRNRSSRLTKFRNTLSNTLERISSVVSGENTIEFKNCIFVPRNQTEDVQIFIRKYFASDIAIRFENCKFIQRGSTVFEKIAKRLRKIFGIIFEMTFPDCIASVDDYTFRLKDIGIISQYVQERITEKG